jgi:hypothetical protein
MFDIVLKRTFEEFQDNFKVALSFAVLFIFVAVFVFFEQFFISSGTVFRSIDTSIVGLVGILAGLVFLYAFSFFVSLAVYAIQRDIHHLSLDDYWNVLLKDAALKIFFFYLVLTIIAYAGIMIGLSFGLVLPVLVLLLIISALLMYVPQSIVFEEKSISEAASESVSFWMSNLEVSILILVTSSVLLFVIMLVEFIFDILGFPGAIVSFVLITIGLVPFNEQMKSYAYILKCDLIRAPEVHQARHHKPKSEFVRSVRLREKNPKGKI